MKPNKKLFFDVLKRVAKHCESEGFVDHPAYGSAWEPANQLYQATLIRSDVSDFIDQLNVSFCPSSLAFEFEVNRSLNSFGINSIYGIPTDAGEWTDCWLYQPFERYILCNYGPWNPLYMDRGFKVNKRKPPKPETNKICTAFERNSTFLFEALKGNYKGRSVRVEHHEIERPN
ncbi:hypothetical protein [Sulfitobacter mediterraneus]|uniref:hypothetical protein n=1 Tax=Sulfitobacter mediterraneus TaxID=83219 RepID=UPI00249249C5|nr:hypothetical protein [Sulfitobacter mediterraneus]